MKGILEFDLTLGENNESEDFRRAQEGSAYYVALWEFNQYISRLNKHNEIIPQEHLDIIQQSWRAIVDGIDL